MCNFCRNIINQISYTCISTVLLFTCVCEYLRWTLKNVHVRSNADRRKTNKTRKRSIDKCIVKSIYKGKEKDQGEIDFSMNREGGANFRFCDREYTLEYIIKESAYRLDIMLIKLSIRKNIQCKSDAKTLWWNNHIFSNVYFRTSIYFTQLLLVI